MPVRPLPVKRIKPAYWDEACKHLAKKDRVMRRLIPQFGDVSLESRGDAFITLARSIVGQQISVKAAMDEDFGTPEAVAVLFELATEINRQPSASLSGLLKGLAGVLGLLQQDPQAFLQAGAAGVDEDSIQHHIQARAAAKAAKNFAEADRIRNELLAQGIVLKDSASGTTWEAAQ